MYWKQMAVKFWDDAAYRTHIEARASVGDREACAVKTEAYATAISCVRKAPID